jgi:methyl-accepting chemotaxis protein
MAKIVDIKNSPLVTGSQKIQPLKSNEFQQKLKEARANDQGQNPTPVETSKLGEIQTTTLPTIGTTSTEIVTKINKLLDLLDNYAKTMDDTGKTLKEIEPLIVSVKKNASQLLEAADQTSPALKRLAEETAVAANVEYVKFYRGDYN